MSGKPTGRLLRHLAFLAARPAERDTDQTLLERFVARRDEAAFAALVGRHGPRVLRVCRRVLGNPHDAEDAFQATFLVLARHAAAIRRRPAVGPWLHGVAHRVAVKALGRLVRRRAEPLGGDVAAAADPTGDLSWAEIRAALHQELDRLADAYRLPLLLCYLEGRTRDEAARHLGWSLGTLKRRLERGRGLLRHRLGRRGLALGAALAPLLVPDPAGAVPAHLARTAAALGGRALDDRALAGLVAPRVLTLAKGVWTTMLVTRLQRILATLAMLALLAGTGAAPLAPAAEEPPGAKTSQAQPAAPQPPPPPPDRARDAGEVKKVDPQERVLTMRSDGAVHFLDVTAARADLSLSQVLHVASDGLTVNHQASDVRHKLAKQVQVVIDGQPARLEDLPPATRVQVTLEKGEVTRIDAEGGRQNGLVASVDAARNVLALAGQDAATRHLVDRDARVTIDGKSSRLADLKPGMRVEMTLSAVKPVVLAVRADGPKVTGVLQAVDPARRTLRLLLPDAHLTVDALQVAPDARITVNGQEAGLGSLKPGTRVTLRMSAQRDGNLVVEIQVGEK